MSIVYSDDSDITYWPLNDLHDKLSSKYYVIDYRPDTWQPNFPYTKGLDLVIPPASNGCMYECISGGISSSIAPTFTTKEGSSLEDSDVKWRTLTFSARLGYGDSITVSAWTASTGVTISNDELIFGKTTSIKVVSIPVGISTFDLVNIVNITRSTGRVETFKKTLRITVGDL